MLGMSVTEILVILALVLILFGPDELPKMAKTIGKGLRDLRKAGDDLRSTFEQEVAKIEEPLNEPERHKPEPVPTALPPAADDPAAARAAARFAAAGIEPPTTPPPAEAKVEAQLEIKLLPPDGSVPQD